MQLPLNVNYININIFYYLGNAVNGIFSIISLIINAAFPKFTAFPVNGISVNLFSIILLMF